MLYQQRYPFLFILLMFLIVILFGCSKQTEPNVQVQEKPPTVVQPSEPPSKKSSARLEAVELILQPESLTLEPDTKYMISVSTLMSNNESIQLSEDERSEIRFTSSDPELFAVNERGIIQASEQVQIGQIATITAEYKQMFAQVEVSASYSLDGTATENEEGLMMVLNPNSIAVVVNKERYLSDDYIPSDLAEVNVPFSFEGQNERRYLRQEAAEALERLFAQAEHDQMNLVAVSGYRSYATQHSLFHHYVSIHGEEETLTFSAYPGTSEHQTGLTMDVSTPSIGNALKQSFADTKEGQWVKENAAEFGFIIRYPEHKEHITGYTFEPWHLRYVGTPLAQILVEQDLTLEEYFAESVPVSSIVK